MNQSVHNLSTDPSPSRRLPTAVYGLALGIFCLGTSEFMLAGLLPQVAAGLGVGLPAAGLLITGFALGMMFGAPVMTVLTLRLPRRATLLGASLVFAAAHVIPLLLDGYAAVMAGRVVAAVSCATYWAVASVVAVKLAGPGRSARALGVVVAGLTVANVLGVPAGTWLGELWGWQAAFVAVAVATVLITIALRFVVPNVSDDRSDTPLPDLLRLELRAFTDRRLWVALLTTATYQAAVFCSFSYISPLLVDVAGVPAPFVPGVLLLFGVGTFVGVTVGGRFADRDLLRTVMVCTTAMILSLVLLLALSRSTIGAVVATVVFGAAAFSVASALNGRVFSFAGDAPTLAASTNVSAFNLGNAVGPWLGGAVIAAGWGLQAPVVAAIGLGLLALALSGLSWWIERRPSLACPHTEPEPANG